MARIREVSAHIATAVAEIAYNRDLATFDEPDDLYSFIKSQMYEPTYAPFI